MKKYLFILLSLLWASYSYAQEHIKFNGATFGQKYESFVSALNKANNSEKNTGYGRNSNHNLYNEKCCMIKLNSETWNCYVFSSRTSNTVFRTISVSLYQSNLENSLMLLVKTLEGKYGAGFEDKKEDLGEVYNGGYYREMLALTYYVKNSSGKKIGEIRISAAPSDKSGTGGYIELSYTDYSAQKVATQEYNAIMNNAL